MIGYLFPTVPWPVWWVLSAYYMTYAILFLIGFRGITEPMTIVFFAFCGIWVGLRFLRTCILGILEINKRSWN